MHGLSDSNEILFIQAPNHKKKGATDLIESLGEGTWSRYDLMLVGDVLILLKNSEVDGL
jgi:hypothetical protein